MAAEPVQLDDEDIVSIDSQPESRKRSRSPVADDQRETSEFTWILDQLVADKSLHTEKPRLDWSKDAKMDLFGGFSDGEDPCVVLTYKDTLVEVPKIAFPHFDKSGKVRQMCHQKGISFIQPNLNKYVTDERGIMFKACGHCYGP
jgi:hypothetical protein